MPDANLTKLIRKTLIAALRASVDTKMFQHIYVRRQSDGVELDTMNGGELSCAFYVSSILAMLGGLDRAHSTVSTTLARLKEFGWHEIPEPRPGAVVTWPAYDGHTHIGFVLDNGDYISNSLSARSPQLHKQQLPDGRKPDAYYWHKILDQE